ncbi:glycoprotein N [Psittacid alphaherpesvirus 1]|uniref:Envelope glycoprotein N n=1 Tax=Psittacid herpesvirus 1 (isolate Amazon parrot/-/97-0001/1997) TaxID=670426 RepID=GN_PSHV1|nr:envelope glycoprotein N [Psittacid alphaherpesvirus 1]Q6UDL9.1 RecName: Full=Envelope glycoprotein N; Flags: Precursor [Psittacid herpesvirus 1 Amazon parrot/1997]AAQ73691.1 glycoprotein N [Psittacid alphaherpesvirus 1]
MWLLRPAGSNFIVALIVLACAGPLTCSAQLDAGILNPWGSAGHNDAVMPGMFANSESDERFYSPHCSSRGLPLVNESMASVIFFLSLAMVCVAIVAILYNCCFNSFKNSVINSRW